MAVRCGNEMIYRETGSPARGSLFLISVYGNEKTCANSPPVRIVLVICCEEPGTFAPESIFPPSGWAQRW